MVFSFVQEFLEKIPRSNIFVVSLGHLRKSLFWPTLLTLEFKNSIREN